ncbi:response regulator [Methylocystis parvus]|uniref:Response regulator transcription factor n=1 Tax=Methylocystis parvus TaxID=134 RepID=A0A6B8MCN7_9HYPH|nr:response regulator transcription factor [Methylocystis parvus]QGN00146.1 response regulator transcription factor [Methylocystis parvus]WBK02545.1 response regulator transcription factor [Methylocystis parvus OBBP]
MSDITILLVDDHPIVREGYRRLLERQPGYRMVAEASDAASAYEAYKSVSPDVVIMDLSLPGASGLEAVRHIRQWDKRAHILVFTMHGGAAFALKAFEVGASGYVTKSSDASELIRAVALVAKGGRALSDDIAREIAAKRLAQPQSLTDELGPRETEILRLVALGKTTDEIAELLRLSPKTIQNYHYQIKSKVGAPTDAHLVWIAIGAGLVNAESLDLKSPITANR